jgi:hypothetical protein
MVDWVTVDGVRTGNRIYWTFEERNYKYNYDSLTEWNTIKITVNYNYYGFVLQIML